MQKNNDITNLDEYRANNTPDISGANIDESATVAGINEAEYGNQVEPVSDHMINAYMEEIDRQTPDLWDRIDAGFDKENDTLVRERRAKISRQRKLIGFAAAAVLLTVIAIPIMNSGTEKSETAYDREFQNNMEEAGYTEMASDGCYENTLESEAYNEDAFYDASYDAQESINESAQAIITQSDDATTKEEIDTEGVQTDERLITVEGEFLYDEAMDNIIFEITKVENNEYHEYEIKSGDSIILSNPDYIRVMSIEIRKVRLTFDSVKVDNFGNIIARIIDLEHIN